MEVLPLSSKLREEFSFVKGNYLILVLSWVLMDFASELPGTYFPKYVTGLGASEFFFGVIMFASYTTLALVQFPGGYLADKHGRRWLVSTMTFGVALSFIPYAIAPNSEVILIAVIVTNICLIYQPALMAMIADALPSKRRGMGFSIVMLVSTVSTTPAPIVARHLDLQYGLVDGMRIAFVIVVVLYLGAAVLRLGLKETIANPQKISFRDFWGSYKVSLKESIHVWKIVPTSAFYLLVIMALGTFAVAMIQPFFVYYALDHLKIGEADWPIALIFLFVAMLIFSIPIGKIVDKIGRKIPLLAAFLVFAPSILLFVYGDFFRLLIALPLAGFAQVLLMTSSSSLQADLVPKEQRGKVTGFTNFFTNVSMAIGSLAGGFFYYFVLPQAPFLLFLPFLVPTFILTLLFVHEPEKREE